MDFADILLKRLDDNELKRPIHALICFSKPETGKALSSLAIDFAKLQTNKPRTTFLHLIDEQQQHHISDINEYKNHLFSEILSEFEQDKISIRTFVKVSDNFVEDILKTSEEQGCNLVLLGIGSNVFNTQLWEKYCRLKRESENSESFIWTQFEPNEAKSLQKVSSLLSRNPNASGIFINNNFEKAQHIFAPILEAEDVHIFTYLYQMAANENITIMVWDAIGITHSDPKVQKLFQYIVKKTDNRIKRWDNDKKIGAEFIATQDLVIIGIDAWDKLISSSIEWTSILPSTLIIKDKTT